MKSRLKEFIPYLIGIIIMFIFMIFASYVYTSLVNSTLQNSLYSSVSGESKKQAISFNELINNKKASFIEDSSKFSTITLTDKDFKVNEYSYFIGSEKAIEGENKAETVYYAYVLVDDDTTTNTKTYIKLLTNDLLSEVNKNEYSYAYALIDQTGAVYGSKGIGQSTAYEILTDSVSTTETEKENIKSLMINGEEVYSLLCDYDSNSYYASVARLGKSGDECGKVYAYDKVNKTSIEYNLYFFTLFNKTHFNDSISQTSNLTLYYRLIIVISLCLIVVDVVLTIRRGNKIFAIGRRTAAKRGIAIIKINKKGKVKYYARGRNTFGIEINDFSTFRPIDGKSFGDSIKHDAKFIAEYDLDSDKQAYAEFVSIPQNGGYLIIANIVTDEYKKQLQVKNLIEQNSITHIPNRNAMLKNFETNRKEYLGKQVTLAFIRILEFQDINRQFGFKAGDLLIRNSVDIIKSCMDDYELYQDNNDTLMVLLVGSYQANDDTFKKITKSFAKPVEITNKSTVGVHVKVGAYELKDVMNKDFDIEDALAKAAQALKRAIDQVSISYVKYDLNLETYIRYKEVMERDMHYALTHDEFVMFYQPQYSVKRHRIEGFESLIRWKNDKYKNVSPQVYIEIAEKNGDIVEIGRIINRQVCKAAKLLEPYHIHLSINVSPAQLMQAGFIDELLQEFRNNDLKQGSICVEITETYIMENYTEMVEKLNILKNAGVHIHLDDFGTGYSSMSYLKQLPANCIKTDKSFIDNLVSDESSRIIERTIIHMASELGLETIVEGVETKEQVSLLDEYGADYLQGYIVSRPVPFDKALELVKNGVEVEGFIEKGGSFDD